MKLCNGCEKPMKDWDILVFTTYGIFTPYFVEGCYCSPACLIKRLNEGIEEMKKF